MKRKKKWTIHNNNRQCDWNVTTYLRHRRPWRRRWETIFFFSLFPIQLNRLIVSFIFHKQKFIAPSAIASLPMKKNETKHIRIGSNHNFMILRKTKCALSTIHRRSNREKWSFLLLLLPKVKCESRYRYCESITLISSSIFQNVVNLFMTSKRFTWPNGVSSGMFVCVCVCSQCNWNRFACATSMIAFTWFIVMTLSIDAVRDSNIKYRLTKEEKPFYLLCIHGVHFCWDYVEERTIITVNGADVFCQHFGKSNFVEDTFISIGQMLQFLFGFHCFVRTVEIWRKTKHKHWAIAHRVNRFTISSCPRCDRLKMLQTSHKATIT